MNLENFTGYVSTLSTLFEEFNFTASNSSLANATNATEFDDYDGNKFILPWWRQLIWSILYSGMVIVATGGNLIVIWIVLAHKRMRTVTNYFLLNLSIADAMVSTLNVIFNYIYMLNSHWPFGTLYCKIAQFTAILSVCASVFTLMAISIDRYMAIMNPLRPRMGRHMTLCIALGTWVVGSVLSCPSLLYFTTFTAGTRVICYAEWPDGPTNLSNQEYAYNVAFLVITYLLPIVAMTYAYTRIGMELWGSQSIGECTQRQMENIKSKRRFFVAFLVITYLLPIVAMTYAYTRIGMELWGSQSIGECTQRQMENIKSKRRVVKMMIVVVVIFGVCWLPYHLYFIVTSYYPEITNSPYIQESYLAIYWLAMSNSMYNPIIYCWMNAKFRRGFQQFFSWCPCIHVTPEALTRREVLTSRHSISGSPDHHRIIKNDTQITRLHSVTYFAGTQTTVGDGYSTGTDTTSLDSKTGSGKRCHSYELRPIS